MGFPSSLYLKFLDIEFSLTRTARTILEISVYDIHTYVWLMIEKTNI
jgi:hypothetical protein